MSLYRAENRTEFSSCSEAISSLNRGDSCIALAFHLPCLTRHYPEVYVHFTHDVPGPCPPCSCLSRGSFPQPSPIQHPGDPSRWHLRGPLSHGNLVSLVGGNFLRTIMPTHSVVCLSLTGRKNVCNALSTHSALFTPITSPRLTARH